MKRIILLVSIFSFLVIRDGQAPVVLTERDHWELFTEAVIWKESRGIEDAVGDSGKAVGVLQIWPIMVREANRLGGSFTYADRYSREKSIEMWNIIQGYYNPDRDFKKALVIWNRNHPQSYEDLIMQKYRELVVERISSMVG